MHLPPISHQHSLHIKLLARFLTINWSFVFQCHCDQRNILSHQPYQASKIHSCFYWLVHIKDHLMTCTVRLSGTVRQLISPSYRRKNNSKMALSYTYTRTSCDQVKDRGQSNIPFWNVTQDSINLTHMCRIKFAIRKPHSILFFPWLTHTLDLIFLWQVIQWWYKTPLED